MAERNSHMKPEYELLINNELLLESMQDKILNSNIIINKLEISIKDVEKYLNESIILSKNETAELLKKYEEGTSREPPAAESMKKLMKIEELTQNLMINYKHKIE